MIRCIDVRKTYRQGESEITALAGISLDIPKGSLAVIMGPSGSGKSTLLHLIGGLDRPSGGDLLVDGRLIGQMADDQVTLFRRKKIGIVFQFFNLLPTLSALENVALPLVLDGRSKAEADHQAEILLSKIGLEKRQHHLPEELSGARSSASPWRGHSRSIRRFFSPTSRRAISIPKMAKRSWRCSSGSTKKTVALWSW